jgi:ribonuclease E
MTVVGTVTEAVKDPIGTGQRVVGTAVGQAVAVAGAVSSKVPGRRRQADVPRAEAPPVRVAEPQEESRKLHGDPVDLAARKTATKKKAPAKKAAKKTTAKKAAKKAPAKKTAKSAAELAAVEDNEVETPVGTTGADVATNPDTTETDLQQVGTEPLVDPSLTNAVKSEAETGAAAADVDKG